MRPAAPKKKNGKDIIAAERFVQTAVTVAQREVYEPKHVFADFAIPAPVLRNITAKGFTVPTPIQDQALEYCLAGRDLVGIANTGTGKTLAFAVPAVTRALGAAGVRQEKNGKRSGQRTLIMAPTRELAQQIQAEMKSFARGTGLKYALLIGGVSVPGQMSVLRGRPEIVIGTPGRIKDHIERGSLRPSDYSMVVLDEFDRMLDMGFIKDIRSIIDKTPRVRQTLFFSATLDARVKKLIAEFTHDPITVSVTYGETAENVSQDIIRCQPFDDKISLLHDVLNRDEAQKVLIFHDTKRGAERLGKKLAQRGFAADSIHGGKTQKGRERALREFKEDKLTVLVATDVAARGIDVSDITHVINYSQPRTYTDYVHRIGRAGRAGAMGYAITFVEAA
jgi:ATP-dependent RNA helicase RhlE